jgi:UDP-GlcNAc:undecaprenyl-phosphate GlcNAc-1-phosphate transferase
MLTNGLIVFLVAISLTMILIPLLIQLAPELGLLDHPDERKVHHHAIPRVGGIAIFVGSVVPMLIWLPGSRLLGAILLALAVLLLFGVWDDRSNISYRYKFIGQILAASIVVIWGDATVYHLPLISDIELPVYLAWAITIIMLVAVTNAVNMSDGLDGLAGGISLLSIGCMTLIAGMAGDFSVFIFGISMVGAILGFLRFNTYPAQVFMGDAGSQLLGFASGLICILASKQSNTAMSLMVPLLVLGLPVLDTSVVMLKRLAAGRSPFSPDRNHIHHRFLDIGFSHREAVYIIYVMQIVLVLLAFKLRYATDLLILVIYALFSLLLLWAVSDRHAIQKRGADLVRRVKVVLAGLGVGRGLVIYRKTAFRVLRYLLSTILVVGALYLQDIPSDFSMLIPAMLGLMLVPLIKFTQVTGHVARFCLYATMAFLAYFIELNLQAGAWWGPLFHLAIVAVFISVALVIRLSRGGGIEFSALDFLLLAVALITSFFFKSGDLAGVPGYVVIEIMVLFYGVNVLFNRQGREERLVMISLMVSLLIIDAKALLF